MSEQPKQVLLIYINSFIHWVGYYAVLGLIHSYSVVPGWIMFLLGIFGILILPPIFRIANKGEEDDE